MYGYIHTLHYIALHYLHYLYIYIYIYLHLHYVHTLHYLHYIIDLTLHYITQRYRPYPTASCHSNSLFLHYLHTGTSNVNICQYYMNNPALLAVPAALQGRLSAADLEVGLGILTCFQNVQSILECADMAYGPTICDVESALTFAS